MTGSTVKRCRTAFLLAATPRSNIEQYFHIPCKRLRAERLAFLQWPSSRGVHDKPLELTSIAGGFATNSSNRAFRHRFGSAATTEHLQIRTYCWEWAAFRFSYRDLLGPADAIVTSVSTWLPVSNVLSACYCLDKHCALKSLATFEYGRTLSSVSTTKYMHTCLLRATHITPAHIGLPGYPACCRCHSFRHVYWTCLFMWRRSC